jgi:hypothetical protein
MYSLRISDSSLERVDLAHRVDQSCHRKVAEPFPSLPSLVTLHDRQSIVARPLKSMSRLLALIEDFDSWIWG